MNSNIFLIIPAVYCQRNQGYLFSSLVNQLFDKLLSKILLLFVTFLQLILKLIDNCTSSTPSPQYRDYPGETILIKLVHGPREFNFPRSSTSPTVSSLKRTVSLSLIFLLSVFEHWWPWAAFPVNLTGFFCKWHSKSF